jgi:hypothetical protein
MRVRLACVAPVVLGTMLCFAESAAPSAEPAVHELVTSQAPSVNQRWIIEGQKRFATNCGRCHQPPHNLSSREMAMAVRHMRVRAMLTEDDMKYVLYYVTH